MLLVVALLESPVFPAYFFGDGLDSSSHTTPLEMVEWRATSARSETRVTCERDKQNVRDRRGRKAEGRGSKFRTLSAIAAEALMNSPG